MTKQVEFYYLFDEHTRTVFWTEDEDAQEDRPDLYFLGSSMNPNKRMTVATMVQDMDRANGYKIKPLP